MMTALGSATTVNAQEKTTTAPIKLSGYIMTQYQYVAKPTTQDNSFNIRLARLSLEGKLFNDFYWKVQVQLNGNTTTLDASPRVLDLFAEWQKYDCFKVKLGQFKRAFTFENPMHPVKQGFMSYSENIMKLAGFKDRCGEISSNGRDIGLQIQGDLLPDYEGRNLLHYQLGVYNGQGINVKDVDNSKDLIGGVWIMPIKGLRIGAFGWLGQYARNGKYSLTDPKTHELVLDKNNQPIIKNGIQKVQRNRYAVSVEYAKDDWTFRSEYIAGNGYAFKQAYNAKEDAKNADINYALGDKSSGYYALVIAPVIKNKMHVKARYNTYQPQGDWNKSKTFYEVGADYYINKNINISGEYAFVKDQTNGNEKYNMVDLQMNFCF